MPYPQHQGSIVIDGHPTEPTWYARTVRVAAYGADFNRIAAAIAWANAQAPTITNPIAVIVYPGTYAESGLVMAANVHLIGEDADTCFIVANDAVNPIISSGVRCVLTNLTIGNTNAAQPAIRLTTNVLSLHSCLVYGTGIGDAIQMRGGTLSIYFSDITVGDIDLSTAPCTLSMFFCKLVADPVDTVGAIGYELRFENCNFGGQNVNNAATGYTPLFMYGCSNVGTLSNAGWGTFTIHCSDLIGVAASWGIILLRGCSYRVVTRTDTGNIVDESPEAKDSIYHVVKLPANSLDNIATRTALGGIVTLGGSGQLRLRINDNALDIAGIENNADAAGGLDSSFTPARTPRYCRQISVKTVFKPTTRMFFGLRLTLGNTVPDMAEDHAGFIWDGANFKASSSNGGGVGGTTNLTTPSVDAQVQLEIIIFGSGAVQFYVDGVLVVTHTGAAKIPTSSLDYQELEYSTGAGGGTTSDITLRQGFVQECSS